MHLHHDKHHQTYVNNVNAALEKHPEIGEDLESLLANVESIPADIRQAVINNGGGHLNHALFWELMTPEQTAPSAELAAAIDATFGSFEDFKAAFTAAATTRFGSGWAWLVVNKEGKRFINELQTRDVVSAAELKQTDKVGYLFFDNSVRKSLKAIETYIKKGLVTEGKTPEELAQKLGINADNLKTTLTEYAKFQADKKDAQFGRADMPRPLTEAPYYAVMVTPAVHHTMGGLRINTEAQVLNHKGNVIPGLFAAGEVTGGVHGGNRLGGNAMADIVTFGRIAGRNAAENPTGVIIPRATPPQTAEKLAHEAK